MFKDLRKEAQKNAACLRACTRVARKLATHRQEYFFVPLNRGFTFVEILVVLAVMIIILTITVNGFSDYSYRLEFRSTVGDVRDGLAEARQKTIASLSNTTYGVYVGTTTIEFFDGASYVSGDPDNVIISVEGGLSATSTFSNGQWYMTFKRLTGEANATGTIVISDLRSNSSTTLTIYGSGLVE